MSTDVRGHAIHLGTVYVWQELSSERLSKLRDDLTIQVNACWNKLLDELDSEVPEEQPSEPKPKASKRKEKVS